MEKKNRKRIPWGLRMFIITVAFNIAFFSLFGAFVYILFDGGPPGTALALIIIIIAMSLLLGLCVHYGTRRVLSYTLRRLVTDMQHLEEGELTFIARKNYKKDEIGYLYASYAKAVGVVGALFNDINTVSMKRLNEGVDAQLDASKYKGAYFGAATSVNSMMHFEDVRRSLRNI